MKLFFRLISISILAIPVSIVGCASQKPPVVKKISPPSSQPPATAISLTFPNLADVELKTGASKTGKVTQLTDKQLEIRLDRDC